MLAPEKLFENFFEDKNITTTRLFNFGNDALNKFIAANGAGTTYNDEITLLTAPVGNVGTALGETDTSINIQLGKTITVDGIEDSFKKTMSDKEGRIRDDLGGQFAPAYLEFYPHGITEYHDATKTNIETLLQRVKTAATTHAAALGTMLSDLLKGFETNYTLARNLQQQQMGNVSDNRADTHAARTALEIALLQVIHAIAQMYPGNVEQCMAFFDFTLLLPVKHPDHVKIEKAILAGNTDKTYNHKFTDSTEIAFKNTGTTAALLVWLALLSTDAPGTLAKEVQPGHSLIVKPSQLGDLENTFLLVKNTSEVNDGSYEINITGPAAKQH